MVNGTIFTLMAHQEPNSLVLLAHAIRAQTAWLKANMSAATKGDLKDMEDRLMKAFGERIDPKAVGKLSDASDKLEKAVESNQPKLSDQ
jgi:hypothetical protein